MPRSAKDRLILALCAKLSAERETRDAVHELIVGGNFDPEILSAILSDPVPVVAQEDLNEAERFLAKTLDYRRYGRLGVDRNSLFTLDMEAIDVP